MQSSSTLRSVLAYTLVGVALVAAIFVGIQVTKNRNTTVATASKPVAVQPANTTPAKQKPSTPAPATNKPAQTAVTPSVQQQTPARVPATGTEDVLAASLALSGLVFTAFMYVQSRRRLMAFR